MDHINSGDVAGASVGGIERKRVFGVGAYIPDENAEMAYCSLRPGKNAENISCGTSVFYVIDTCGVSVEYGSGSAALENGMVLRSHEGERFSFRFNGVDSYARLLSFASRG